MELEKVFEKYIDLCKNHSGHLPYYLASNAVLDWFSRTIRGKEKIKNFIRYELSQEYDQEFSNWKSVDPFENRPSHFETKKTQSNSLPESSINTQRINDGNTTPPQNNIRIVELPPLHQGRKFIPESDSDEEDFKDLGLAKILDPAPPSSPAKQNFNSRAVDEPPTKKCRIIKLKNFASSRLPSKEKSILNDKKHVYSAMECDDFNISCKTEIECRPIDLVEKSAESSKYSDIHYVEAIGRLKYRDAQDLRSKIIHSKGQKNSETTSNKSLHPEREVKLKISYRIRLDDNRIEFALIIYEHSIRKPTIRRNLLLEFEETSTNLDEIKPKLLNKPKVEVKNEKVKIKRKTPLKRFLRLF